MKLTFLETHSFTQEHLEYFSTDEVYAEFQQFLLKQPESGKVIPGCNGLRKIRWRDSTRGKGKRGGLRIIYLYLPEYSHIFILDIYDKDEADELSPREKKILNELAQTYKDSQKQRRSS